jgi:hypothetical protein
MDDAYTVANVGPLDKAVRMDFVINAEGGLLVPQIIVSDDKFIF